MALSLVPGVAYFRFRIKKSYFMACENSTNAVAKVAGRANNGISRLSGKQAFYAGVGTGAFGATLVAIVAANRKRIAGFFRGSASKPPSKNARPIRPPAKPIPGLSGSVGSGIRPPARPIPGLSGATGGGSRPAAKPIPGLSGPATSKTSPPAKPIPGLSAPPGQTKLKPASISLLSGRGYEKKEGYEVIREDGAPTGLALTPYAGQTGEADGSGEQWGVTHIRTGKLIDGPYQDIPQAQALAAKLAPLQWDAKTTPPASLKRAGKVISEHRQTLAGNR